MCGSGISAPRTVRHSDQLILVHLNSERPKFRSNFFQTWSFLKRSKVPFKRCLGAYVFSAKPSVESRWVHQTSHPSPRARSEEENIALWNMRKLYIIWIITYKYWKFCSQTLVGHKVTQAPALLQIWAQTDQFEHVPAHAQISLLKTYYFHHLSWTSTR